MIVQRLIQPLLLAILCTGAARAIPYFSGGALPADVTVDFEGSGLNENDPVTNQFGGLNFTNFFFGPPAFGGNFGSPGFVGNNNFPGGPIAGVGYPDKAILSFLQFDSVVSSASFQFVHYSQVTLAAFLGSTQVDVQTLFGQSGSVTEFVGFYGVQFDSILFQTVDSSNGSDLYLDNLGYTLAADAPELDRTALGVPLTCSILMLMLAGRRRRQQASA